MFGGVWHGRLGVGHYEGALFARGQISLGPVTRPEARDDYGSSSGSSGGRESDVRGAF